MAGVKISALQSLPSTSSSDVYPTVQAGVTYKVTLAQLLEHAASNIVVRLATTAALTATYNNGSSGVGATLTNAAALAALTIDGTATVAGDRVLIKNQATDSHNGIYTVTTVGDGVTAWVLTRATDYDESSDVDQGDFISVGGGTTNGKTQWIQINAGPFTIGTTAINFESNIVAGANILKTNNSIAATGNMTTSEVTSATQAIAVNTRYIANRGGGVAFSLPPTSAVGDVFSIVGKSGVWSITQGAGQQLHVGSTSTTLGAGGSLTAAAATDSVKFVCITANTIWQVEGGPQTSGFVIV